MAVVSKALALLCLLLLPVASFSAGIVKISKCFQLEVILSFVLLFICLMSLLSPDVSFGSAAVSMQFPIIYFLLSISSPLIFVKFRLSFDDFVAKSVVVIFSSWLLFSLLGILVLGDSFWWMDQGVSRLKGALGVAPSSVLNSLIFTCCFYLVFCLKRYNFLLIMFTAFLCVFYSGTRISLVACMIGIFFILTLTKFRFKLFYLIVGFPVVLYAIYNKIFIRLVHAGGSFKGFDSINFNGRLYLWDILWKDIDNFFLGQGIGTSAEYLMVHAVGVGVQPHNDYIRLIHDIGFLGLIVFLTIILVMAVKLICNIRCAENESEKQKQAFLLGLTFSFIALMFTDNVFIYVFYFFPFLLFYFHALSPSSQLKDRF